MAHKLWSCCCKDLQKDLQHVGFVTASVEQEILTNIKDLTVKAINPLLNFCDYFKMYQKEGENVHQYMVRLKGAAHLCNFTVSSGSDTISYADQMVLGSGQARCRSQGQADHKGDPRKGRHQGTIKPTNYNCATLRGLCRSRNKPRRRSPNCSTWRTRCS